MYQNPAIICVLRSAYFGTFTALGYKFKNQYISSPPDESEPELTIPLVALAATGVRLPCEIYLSLLADKYWPGPRRFGCLEDGQV